MLSIARSSELYIIPNVIVKNIISNRDKPNILSLFGKITGLLVLFFLFFSPLSSFIFEILRVKPKNTMSMGLTAGPTGFFNIQKQISLIRNGKAATDTVYINQRSNFIIQFK